LPQSQNTLTLKVGVRGFSGLTFKTMTTNTNPIPELKDKITPSEKIEKTPSVEKTTFKKPMSSKDKTIKTLKMIGLGFFEPIINLIAGEEPKKQLQKIWNGFFLPIIAFVVFILIWQIAATNLKSDLGKLPTPAQTWEQADILWKDHIAERKKQEVFHQRVTDRNAKILARNPNAKIVTPTYTGKPTFIDQIVTSLKTVFFGFLLGSLVALPIGIFMGLSKTLRTAINPLIQILKPVSPVVWLLIVTMVVSALISTNEFWMMPKAFIISFISVALCCMWPTLVNTSVGVSSVDKDFINVARVLNLNLMQKIFKVILPASLPMVFTGLRISLSIAWMVLIAIELLAQNPGLGKFVWDEFQNNAAASNAKIVVALFVIGFIGFGLDKLMLVIQKWVTFNKGDLA
jgi:nitrate/nitrite transport system permease protein